MLHLVNLWYTGFVELWEVYLFYAGGTFAINLYNGIHGVGLNIYKYKLTYYEVLFCL
jgi:hypothetical protein